MGNQSSLFTTSVAVIAIFVVLFMVLTNIDEAPVRKPFVPKNQVVTEDADSEDLPSLTFNEGEIAFNTEPKPETEVITPVSGESTGGLSYQNLKAAGLNEFVLEKRPLEGKVFDLIGPEEVPAAGVEKSVIKADKLNNGLKEQIIDVWTFKVDNKEMADEVYQLLKARFFEDPDVIVNETNQIGLKSFYINFTDEKNADKLDLAFLVVKTNGDVYALSYQRESHDLIKALFKLL